jgi:predicted Zn-dependent protease with MMP-like domain
LDVSAAPDNGLVTDVEPGRFEDMVVTALDGLPEELGRLMRNVAVTVEHGPGPPGLLGVYQGIPLTSRTSQYAGVLPDRITIYRQAICAICRTEQEVAEQVRRTVIHEIVSSGTQVSAENARSSSRRDGLAVSQSTKPARAPPAHTAFHGDASR